MSLTLTEYIIFSEKCAISIQIFINENLKRMCTVAKGAEARRRRTRARRTRRTRVETIPFTGLFS